MKSLRLKIIMLGILSLCESYSANAQVKVSQVIQESKIVETESNTLFFVDFWATWCGPCVYAKKMLTVLQKQYPNDFYVLSISDESADLVKRYLKNKPTQLAIGVDEEALTFKKYNIYSRPNGILFNAKGDKLWQGHPSDLKPELLNKFLRQNKTRKSLYEFIEIVDSQILTVKDYFPKEDFEIKPSNTNSPTLDVSYNNSYIRLDGALKDILSHLSKVNHKQIQIASNINKNYEVYLKQIEHIKNESSQLILENLGLQVVEEFAMGEVISLQVNDSNFWDTNQINWGDVESKFLVSDTDIQADNVSLKDLSFELSRVLDIPIVISNEDERSLKKHDWQLHYKYFEFMSSNFLEYGVKVRKEKSNFPSYTITKKAP